MAKTVVSKSVQRRLAIQKAAQKPVPKAGKKPKPVKTVTKPVKKVKVKPEPAPIESEQEVEFDDTEYDGHEEAFEDVFNAAEEEA